MKKIMAFLMTILACTLIVTACSSDDKDNQSDNPEVENDDQENKNETSDDDSKDEENEKTESTESGESDLGIEEKDQPDLAIGDTAKVDTIEGTFDLTLESVKIMEELDGEKSELDSLILLDIKLKNTSDETLEIEDLLSNFEVTDSLDGTGNPDGAEFFDSVEKMEGPIEPDEEVTGQFVTYIYDKDEYYFRLRSGYSGSGKSNTVIFTFKSNEAK